MTRRKPGGESLVFHLTVADGAGLKSEDTSAIHVKGMNNNGSMITSDLWIRAVINTLEKGPVEAAWQKGGEDMTAGGHRVIWGYFYASPDDVNWGSRNNPDLFVKIWFDAGGRIDVNYFHVSVPDIEVYSDYFADDNKPRHDTATLERRYIRQYYENGEADTDDNYEDGISARKQRFRIFRDQ